MQKYYIDLGSSTIKVYCYENELKLIEEHSIYFKNDFDREKGISESNLKELCDYFEEIKTKYDLKYYNTNIFVTGIFRNLTQERKQDLVKLFNERFDLHFNIISHCPEVCLKQVFGENYKSKSLDTITLLKALELERLMYKSKGLSEYETKLIELPMVDSDFPPNTIFDQSEQTTVTKMERRVFDLDIKKLKTNCQINTPSSLYLNFFQHLGVDFKGESGNFNDYYFNRYLREYFDWLERETEVEISALGTSAKNGDMILKKALVKNIQKG